MNSDWNAFWTVDQDFNKGIFLQQENFQKVPPFDFSAGLCGHDGCLALAVEPKYGKNRIWKWEGVAKSDGKWIRLWNACTS